MRGFIIGFLSFFYQANLNHENMQGTGFAYLIRRAARLKGMELEVKKVYEQTSYFHTHPYLVNFIVGMWVREFEQHGEEDFHKKIYSSAFGALGDSFFWHSLRPLCFATAAVVGLYDPFAGILTYLVLYNVFHFSFRFTGFRIGYQLGRDVITFFNRIRFNKWATYFDIASSLMFGILLSFVAKTCTNFNSVLLGTLTVYVMLGMALAKKLDIVLGLTLIIISTGLFLFMTGV